MDKENLIAHVENLAPGLVTVLILGSQVPASSQLIANPKVLELLQQPFIAGILLPASAYLIGVAVFVMSRLVLDTLSEWTFRPLLLKLYRWQDFNYFNPVRINEKYRWVLNAALNKDKDSSIRQEVLARRQRGRLLRTLLIPAALTAYGYRGPLGAAKRFRRSSLPNPAR